MACIHAMPSARTRGEAANVRASMVFIVNFVNNWVEIRCKWRRKGYSTTIWWSGCLVSVAQGCGVMIGIVRGEGWGQEDVTTAGRGELISGRRERRKRFVTAWFWDDDAWDGMDEADADQVDLEHAHSLRAHVCFCLLWAGHQSQRLQQRRSGSDLARPPATCDVSFETIGPFLLL